MQICLGQGCVLRGNRRGAAKFEAEASGENLEGARGEGEVRSSIIKLERGDSRELSAIAGKIKNTPRAGWGTEADSVYYKAAMCAAHPDNLWERVLGDFGSWFRPAPSALRRGFR